MKEIVFSLQRYIALFLFVIVFVACGQESIEKQFPTQELLEDVEVLQAQLQKYHPGLYTYTSKKDMDAAFDSIRTQLQEPLDAIDFYRRLLPLHNKIRNGHTFIIPSEVWSKAAEANLFHFPFDIYWDDRALYLLRNFSANTEISVGSKIISINGIKASEVYWKLVEGWTKDGFNTTFPEKIVHQDFSEFYLNSFGSFETFDLEIEQHGIRVHYQVAGMPISAIREMAKRRYNFDKLPWYNDNSDTSFHFSMKDQNAFMTLPTFNIDVIKDNKTDYESFFKSCFTAIEEKEISNLVIDIRGNGGGHGDVASELFSYLHKEPFTLIKDIYAIANKIEDKKMYQGKISSVNLQMKLGLNKVGASKYVPKKAAAKKNHLTLGDRNPSFPNFNGQVIIVMDGWSFSASGMFTALMTKRDNTIFVGEEAGGNPHTQVGDFEQMLVLPNSKVRIRIPLLVQYMDVDFENNGHGVLPDYPVRNSIQQEMNNQDAVMDFVMDLLLVQ